MYLLERLQTSGIFQEGPKTDIFKEGPNKQVIYLDHGIRKQYFSERVQIACMYYVSKSVQV